MGVRIAVLAAGIAAGVGLTRWYDRSRTAHRFVFWLFTADVRRTDPHLYGRSVK